MRKWEVYFAYVRYEDIPGGKARPVLVVDDDRTVYPIECLKLTSHAPRDGEYALVRWRQAGLMRPTTVRLGKLLQVEQSDFIRRLGTLDPVDIFNIQNLLSQ